MRRCVEGSCTSDHLSALLDSQEPPIRSFASPPKVLVPFHLPLSWAALTDGKTLATQSSLDNKNNNSLSAASVDAARLLNRFLVSCRDSIISMCICVRLVSNEARREKDVKNGEQGTKYRITGDNRTNDCLPRLKSRLR